MLQTLPQNVSSTLEFSVIQKSSSVARSDATCDDVMHVAISVFSTLSAMAFVSCLTAAIMMPSAALGVVAGVVALVAIILLLSIACINEPIDEDFRNTTIYGVPSTPNSPYAESIAKAAAFQDWALPSTPNTPSSRRSISRRLDFDEVFLD